MRPLIVTLLTLFLLNIQLAAQAPFTSQIDSNTVLTVGIKVSPPFIFKDDNQQYKGICIALWEDIAKQLDLKYEYKEYPLSGIITHLKDSTIDISINPLTVTSERIENINFTQPFYVSNSVIAVRGHEDSSLKKLFDQIFSWRFLEAVLSLMLTMCFFGILMWLLERNRNDQFEKGWQGAWSGIWWSAATMTTVGYGDKAPETFGGRIVGLFWMFAALLVISGLLAGIASALTINHLENEWTDINSLRKAKVATLNASATENFLRNQLIKTKNYETMQEGFQALINEERDAFVYDEPILRYEIDQNNLSDSIKILPFKFNTQYYSFATPKNSALAFEINPILLEVIESVSWKAILTEYDLRDL